MAGAGNNIIIGGGYNSISASTSSIIGNGGYNNIQNGAKASILNGYQNIVSGSAQYSTIIGGSYNKSYGNASFIGNGSGNIVGVGAQSFSTILNGVLNLGSGTKSLIGNGYSNSATTTYSSVINGYKNLASAQYSSVINGKYNISSGIHSSVIGGRGNQSSGYLSSTAGGLANKASSNYSSINNGKQNEASGQYSFIGNGLKNIASGNGAVIVGGGYQPFLFSLTNNIASGQNSFIGNGFLNSATTNYSTVLNGQNNLSSGIGSSILAGTGHTVSGRNSAVIGGGSINGSANDTVYVPNLNVQSGKVIKTDNGGGQIDLDYGGVANTLMISSDSGAFTNGIFLGNDIVEGVDFNYYTGTTILSRKPTNLETAKINVYDGKIDIGVTRNTGGSSQFLSGIYIGQNANVDVYSNLLDLGRAGVLINSSNSVVLSGVTNSVVLGGTAITATTNDTVYVPDLNFQLNKGISFNTGVTRIYMEIPTLVWDMVASNNITVPHSLSASEWKTARNLSCTIRNDVDTAYYELNTDGGVIIASTGFSVYRNTGGIFDDTAFDSTGVNRGLINFWYTPD